ncbi:hypothetical protein Tco_0594547, partial [Tanacetum coccineum]
QDVLGETYPKVYESLNTDVDREGDNHEGKKMKKLKTVRKNLSAQAQTEPSTST